MRTGMEWREGGLTRFLPYEDGEKGGVKIVRLEANLWEEHPAMPSPALIELEHAVESMAEATGFYKDSLVTYLLTGIAPTLSAFKTTAPTIFHECTDISRLQVTLDLLTGDVRDEEVRQAYRQYRKKFSTTRQKRQSAENKVILALVKQHGKPPEGRRSGAKDYWEKIRREGNEILGYQAWKDPWFARRNYNRLMAHAPNKGVKR